MRLNIKKQLKSLITEIILNELFDSKPFKSNFEFNENVDEIFTLFKDLNQNNIKVLFYKDNNNTYYLDFNINGYSKQAPNVEYSLKDYTILLATVAKCVSQFLTEYKPNAIRIDGDDSFEKIVKGKEGQKINIYGYFINQMEMNSNYSIQDADNGNFDIIKTKITKESN